MLVLIAPNLDDINVLQEELAPFVSELNTYLAQKLEKNPREGVSSVCLTAINAKEMSRQIDDKCMTYQSTWDPALAFWG